MEYEVVADIVWQHTAVLPVITRKHKIQQQQKYAHSIQQYYTDEQSQLHHSHA